MQGHAFPVGLKLSARVESLKQCLIAAPVLDFPNIDDPFLMEMDATGIDLGTVLAQKQEDVSVLLLAYASRSLQKHEQNYGVTELEALAVLWEESSIFVPICMGIDVMSTLTMKH